MIPRRFSFLLAIGLGSGILASCAASSSDSPPPPEPAWKTDTFGDSASLSRFLPPSSATWKWANGAISCRGTASQSYLVRKDVSFRDGWVEADVDSVDDGGIALRVKNTQNMILLALHDNSAPYAERLSSRLQLWIISNGNYRIIDSAYHDWPRGVLSTLKLKAYGDTLEIWANGRLKCRKIDSTIREPGGIALRHHGGTSDPNWKGTSMVSHYLALRWLQN
jgi:hypothetical protein